MTRSHSTVLGSAMLAVGILVTTTVSARQASLADSRLQAALTKEVVEGKCDEAIPLYQEVLKTAGVSRATAAQAQAQLTGCLKQTGKSPDQGTTSPRFPVTTLPKLRNAVFGRTTFSPDGKKLAYVFTDEDQRGVHQVLMLLDLATNQEHLLDDAQAAFRDPATFPRARAGYSSAGHQWSPDGKYLSYQIRRSGTNLGELRVLTAATGQIRTVKTTPALGTTPWRFEYSWAPDSDTIICHVVQEPPARGAGPVVPEVTDVMFVSVSSGQSRTVGSTEGAVNAAWSPDRRLVAFREVRPSEKVHQIRVVNLAGSESKTFGGAGSARGLRWSPDGRSVAARELDDAAGVDRIRIITVATGESRVVDVPREFAAAGLGEGWTAKNEFYLNSAVANGGTDYILLPATGGSARKICETRRDADSCQFLTPDGATQVLRTAAGRLVLRNTATGRDVPLTMGAGEENAPILSSDGKLLTFASNRNGSWGLYAAPLDKAPVQDPVLIASIDSVAADRATPGLMTSTGQLLLQTRSGEDNLYRIDLDPQTGRAIEGRKPVRLTVNYPHNDWPEPSPDGKLIAFIYTRGNRQGIAVMNSDGTRERSLVEFDAVRTGPGPRPTDAPRLSAMTSWRSADEVMFYEQGLKVVNVQTRNVSAVKLILAANLATYRPWAYVPSRDEVLYIEPAEAGRIGGELRAQSLATGAERTLVSDAVEFVVSPDGQTIGYRKDLPKGAGELRRLSIGGQDLGVIKSFPPRQGCCPASPESWSPDARLFLYSGPSGRHRVTNVQTADDGLLFDHDAEPAVEEWDFPGSRWSPDGTYVVVEGMSTRIETRLWSGVTYEAVSKLMSARR